MPNVNGGVLDGVRRIAGRFRDLAVDGGVPGAPLGFRLRGATSSGPPAAGTWKTGDMVPDRTGSWWTCTAGGTPGTWTRTLTQNLVRVNGPVAGGTALFGSTLSNGTDTGTNSRGAYTLPYYAGQLTAMHINYPEGSNGEGTAGNAVTVTASVEYPSGSFTQLTWNGAPSVTIQSGGFVTCDPVTLNVGIPANTTFWIRTFLSVTSGQKWQISGWAPGQFTSTGGTTQTDQTLSGTITGTYATTYLPSCVKGIGVSANTLRIAGIGDSITAGYQDTNTPQGLGWFGRAFTGYRYVKLGQSGLKISGIGSGVSLTRTLALAAGANAATVMFGTNDFANGIAATTAETYLINLMLTLQSMGMACYSCTIPPLTTSTDNWATTANQTVTAHEAIRVSLNQWLRAGLPVNASTFAPVAVGTGGALVSGQAGHPVTRVYDLCSAVETSQDSGIWKATGSAFGYTADGTHPSPNGYSSMAAVISVPAILADLGVSS